MPDLPTMPTQPTLCNYGTRWYPRLIQKLVSTYKLPNFKGVGAEGASKLKVRSPGQISLGEGGLNWGSQNSKCQVLAKLQIVD